MVGTSNQSVPEVAVKQWNSETDPTNTLHGVR